MKFKPSIQRFLPSLAVGLVTTSNAQFVLVEDFETGFTAGETVSGINGWVSDSPDRALALEDPLGSTGIGVQFTGGGRNDTFKALDSNPDDGVVLQIAEGDTGTFFFEAVFALEEVGTANNSFGLSTLAEPNGFGPFQPQLRLLNEIVSPRDGGGFTDTVFGFDSGVRLQFWLVVDNAAATYDIFLSSPTGLAGQVQVADDFAFRTSNGNPIITFYTILGNAQDVFIDNLFLDPIAVNLSDPNFVDTDGDGLNDNDELAATALIGAPNLTDLTTPFDGVSSGPGSGDFDGDGISDEQEFELGANPVLLDSDGDGLLDADEFDGTSNAFDGTPTDLASPDTDSDGLSDFEENGSVNIAFGNAPTNPNALDTDGDGIDDGFEIENNTEGTALDPNDDGSSDPDQAPGGDLDGDGLTNSEEFAPVATNRVQTRADLLDTDGDTISDFVEDNFGEFGVFSGNFFTGTNPTLTDTDGDGLLDNEEDPTLEFSPGSIPVNSNPNILDTDGDGFNDSIEASEGSDPSDINSVPAQSSGFVLIEDFEGDGMVIGNTFVGINGWTSDAPQVATVVDEPIEGGDQIGSLDRSGGGGAATLSRSLLADLFQIGTDSTGTLYFQLLAASDNLDHSIGLSDQEAPTAFGGFEAQLVLLDGLNRLRDGAIFRDFAPLQIGTWVNVWIVADNSLDEVRVYMSVDGQTGQIEVTADDEGDPINFRNGTEDLLQTLQITLAGAGAAGSEILVDNFFIDPLQENLTVPAVAKPEGSILPPVDTEIEITSVTRAVNGDLAITFTPGGATGFILTSASPADLEIENFAVAADADFDGVDTFTVPAAFIGANPTFFFRVEEQ